MAVVVKVGGSLYDLPDLGARLRRFLAGLAGQRVLLVPGGGAAADAVRDLDRFHQLSEESAHWLALRAVSLNAHFLAALLAPVPVVADPEAWLSRAPPGDWAILDGHTFARRDEREHPGQALPRSWNATSDSLALRVARVLSAERLLLLKSVSVPPGTGWETAARRGWVDACFPEQTGHAQGATKIEVVNLRA